MNVRTNSTAGKPRATEDPMLRALKDLEGPICDAVNMAGLVTAFFDGCRHEIDGESAVIRMARFELEQLTFGLYDVERRVKALHKEFYAAFDAEGDK